MSFFEKLGKDIEEWGKKSKDVIGTSADIVEKKSKQVVEITKLKYNRTKLENEKQNQLLELGQIIYKGYVDENLNEESATNICQKIKGIDREIEKLTLDIDSLSKK